MKINSESAKAFSLIELIVVIAVIAILAALLFPVVSAAKRKAQRTTCLNNLHQISLAVRMYADDSSDAFPPATNHPPASFVSYTVLLKSYVGTGVSPERARLFACPADTWCYTNAGVYVSQSIHQQARFYYSSYAFNGGNFLVGNPPAARWPGVAGRKLTSVREPVKTVLVLEFPALNPYSWHEPGGMWRYNNAKDMVSFVDGHVSFIKMYWNATKSPNRIESWQYDPPAGYDYKWSGD
jgi:prepilin-type N-terminal cleavage/methylation domain-containing protein